MKKETIQKNKFSELRARVEQQLTLIPPVDAYESGNVMELVHELYVRQLELEMQNDELRNTQQKLEQLNLNYAALFDFAPIAYLITDKKGIILDLNYVASYQLGMEKYQLKGKPFSVFLNNTVYQDNFYLHTNRVIESETAQHLECEIKRKDNTIFNALLETTVVKDEQGEFKHFLLMITDISEQKEQNKKVEVELIKEKELSNYKSEFIALASCEFHTLLSTIVSSSDLLEAYIPLQDKEKQIKQVNKIKKSATRLTEMVNNFISIDKLKDQDYCK